MAEPRILKNLCSLYTPLSHLANGDNLQVCVEFIDPFRQLGERNQLPANVGDLVLVFIPHIEQKKVLAGIQPLFQFFDTDFRNAHRFLPCRIRFGDCPICRTRLNFDPK